MRKIYSFLLVLLMAVMSVGTAKAAYQPVETGDGWRVGIVDGEYTLEISDAKHFRDYASSTDVAWSAYSSQIVNIGFTSDVPLPHYVGLNMFANMPELIWVSASNYAGAAQIGTNAFRNCPKLKTVSIADDITSVDEKAFENCSSLDLLNSHINGPIGKYAFHNCYHFKHASGAITSIGEYAFANCTRLDYVSFESCTTIGAHAFEGCTKMYAEEMKECTSIGEAAFKNCENLGGIKALKCKTIGKNAFENCQLSAVELGSAIQSIGNYAFDYGIRDNGWIKIDRNTPPTTGTNVFNQVNCYTILLFYPQGATSWNVAPWNDFRLPNYNQTPNICLYAVQDYGTNTLTFYYGDMNQAENAIDNWNVYAITSVITKIVIDPSVANAPLTTLKEMFYNFSKVTEIEGFEYFNTKNVTSMESMFSNCKALQSIDLSRLNSSNVTNMSMMFSFCSKLQSIDLTRFDMSNVTDVSGMFYNCAALTTIYCDNDWSTNSTISNSDMLFSNSRQLVGGKGTPWDASHVDKTYARPDDDNQPGYFTRTIIIPDIPNHEGIENTNADTNANAAKIIRDGQVLIIRDGKIYNAQGAQIK